MAKIRETEFIRRAAREAEVRKEVMHTCWVGIVNTLIDIYCDGDEVTVKDLGTFRLRKTKPRLGYDFATGEKNVMIPGGASPTFRPCVALRKAADANYKERLLNDVEDELPDEL